jgi:hypothetical protein
MTLLRKALLPLVVLASLVAPVMATSALAGGDYRRESAGNSPDRTYDRSYRISPYFGYGGPTIWQEFPRKGEERRWNHHYYPQRWGGYAYSAPYYVHRKDYIRPTYRKVPYGALQKKRFYKEFRVHRIERERW